jgi:pyruvate/2-oxoglutarate dehydrogenase complex dihydrolipoamide acyltransferase (E2) component
MPKFKNPGEKSFVMNMGFNSKDSDTTFKEKDQANMKAGPGKYSKYPLDNAIISGAVKVFKGFGKIRGSGSSEPAPKSTASAPKTPSTPAKPAASAPASAPKKQAAPKPYVKKGGKATGSIKNYAVGSDARRKEYDARGWAYDNTIKKPKTTKPAVSSIKPKPTSITPKPKAAALTSAPKTTTSTPKTKSSKIKAKGEAALASGNVKKAQRIRKRYDRVTKKENKRAAKSGVSIADAYKVNL